MGYAPGNSVIEWALPIGYIEYELLVCEIPIDKNAPNNPICSNLTSFNMNIFDCFETFFMNWQELNTMQIQRTTEPTKLALDIQEWIHKNWQKNFKLQDLAKELGICPSLISRYFKKTFGMSPLKYTNQMRIVSSVRDLLKSQRPISQISFDLGFGDTRQFNEHFRKIYPVKPFAFKLPKR